MFICIFLQKSVQVLILQGLQETFRGPEVYKVITGEGESRAGGLRGQGVSSYLLRAKKKWKYSFSDKDLQC